MPSPRPGPWPTASQEEPIATALAMDPVRLELGYGLLSLIGDDRGQRLPHQIKALRRQLAAELGFVMPSVRIQDNIQLPANTYVVRLKEIEAGRGEIRSGMLLVMDPQGRPITLPGEVTTEPTFGLAASWVVPGLRDEAMLMGLTVVDPATVITTHLTELVRDNLADLLTYAETQKLLGELPAEYQKLMGELVPARITTAGIQRVLQGLLAERISIRDLPSDPRGDRRGAGTDPEHRTDHRACSGPARAADHHRLHRRIRLRARSSPCRRPGSRHSPPRSSARATSASWPWRPPRCNASCARCRSRSRRTPCAASYPRS